MSLREEIAALMCERYSGPEYLTVVMELIADVEIADELVNKILDAVCERVNNVGLSTDDEKATIKAINKLRQEKGDKR